MYFDFEDRRPDTPILERPLTRLEQLLLTVIAYLLIVIFVILYPRMPWVKAAEAARLQRLEEQRQKQQEEQRDQPRFVFVQPRVEMETKVPPTRAELSDRTRRAQTMERAPDPKNDVAFSRGNSGEKIISDAAKERPQPSEPAPPP